jgi:hypothetical protein
VRYFSKSSEFEMYLPNQSERYFWIFKGLKNYKEGLKNNV